MTTKRENVVLWYRQTVDPDIQITVNGMPAVTQEMAAARYDTTPNAIRIVVARHKDTLSPVAYLDARRPLFLVAALDALMAGRPGKGSPGRPRMARLRKPKPAAS